MDHVRFGIVGVGGMGTGHARSLQEMPEGELTAVCDIVPDVANAVGEEFGVPFCTAYQELVDRSDVDVVVVATPHYFHPEISIYAMEQGKAVISEKPIAVTVAAADAMLEAAKRTGTPFAAMHQSRTEAVWRAAHELVQSGRLGELYRTMLVYADFRSQAYYDSAGWRATWAGEGGGVLMNQAPHSLDRFTWLGGLPSKVTAYTATAMHRIEVEDLASAILTYPNGATGYIYCSTTESPGTNLLELSGERGKLRVLGSQLTFWEIPDGVRGYSDTTDKMWGAPLSQEVPVELPECDSGHVEVLRNMANHLMRGDALLTPGVEGIKSVELINAMILSGHAGEPVDVPVDRARYDAFLAERVAASRPKESEGPDRRETDHFNR